jgi:preprotein translocase subunit SecA
VYAKRQAILLDKEIPQLLVTSASEEYHKIHKRLGEIKTRKFEKQLTLYYINKCWAEYLDHMAYVRESIHLVSVGRQNPLDEFIKKAINSFDMMWERINSQITQTFKETYTEADIFNLESMGIKRPSSTWAYLINDDINQLSKLPLLEKLLQPILRI